MFFEFPEPDARRSALARMQRKPWQGPPSTELCAHVALDAVLARGHDAVVHLTDARVYSTGWFLNLEVVNRQGEQSGDDWLVARMGLIVAFGLASDLSPDRILRIGVRYPDGGKATNLDGSTASDIWEREPGDSDEESEEPTGPVMTWQPFGGGAPYDPDIAVQDMGFWLWPLPPAEPFEVAVEWPAWGIPLTFTELDGAEIVAAAGRTQPCFIDD